MGWRGTAVLALGLFAAAFVLYRELAVENPQLSWQSVMRAPRDAPPGEQIVHLLLFDPATVSAIRVQRRGQEWRTQRRDGGWSGVDRSSDIDDYLDSLLGLAEIMPLDVSDDELANHGLDPPEAVIELERAGEPPVVLFLGRRNPPATGVYAQLGPRGRVVLTGALALWEFDKAIRALSPTAAP